MFRKVSFLLLVLVLVVPVALPAAAQQLSTHTAVQDQHPLPLIRGTAGPVLS